MIACIIKDIKQFMNLFLNSETFDKFTLEEGRLVTFYTMELDGRTVKEYYEGSSDRPDTFSEFVLWRDIRPVVLSQIAGKKTPVSFHFTLHADAGYTRRLIEKHQLSVDEEKVKCLAVNIRFEHGKLTCITGTAFTTFVADKSLEHTWDRAFKKSLDLLHLDFEEQ